MRRSVQRKKEWVKVEAGIFEDGFGKIGLIIGHRKRMINYVDFC